MAKIERRDFLKSAAVTAGGLALGAGAAACNSVGAAAAGSASAQDWRQYRVFSWRDLPPARPAQNVEVLWQTPFPAGNGMQATSEGLWMVDGQTRGPEGERTSHVYLLNHDGEILRDFRTEGETPSGMTSDGETLWIGATYSRTIVRVDPHTGATISTHFTPGASVIYNTPWDPPRRQSPLSRPQQPATRPPAPQEGRAPQGAAPPPGSQPGAYREGTGAHGMEFKDGKLWVAVPPSRMLYRIDPETWTVEHEIPMVHKRAHGIGFEGDYLWESDTDVSAFYKRDPESGEVLEAIRLGDEDPQPHGMSYWDGYLWWVDDVPGNSWVCRMRV